MDGLATLGDLLGDEVDEFEGGTHVAQDYLRCAQQVLALEHVLAHYALLLLCSLNVIVPLVIDPSVVDITISISFTYILTLYTLILITLTLTYLKRIYKPSLLEY